MTCKIITNPENPEFWEKSKDKDCSLSVWVSGLREYDVCVPIDKSIAPLICLLNNKGIKTQYCCSGIRSEHKWSEHRVLVEGRSSGVLGEFVTYESPPFPYVLISHSDKRIIEICGKLGIIIENGWDTFGFGDKMCLCLEKRETLPRKERPENYKNEYIKSDEELKQLWRRFEEEVNKL